MPKKTLIIGASTNPSRYSFSAVQALKSNGHPVVAIGVKSGAIDGIEIQKGKPDFPGIDTVSLYIGPYAQESYKDYLIKLKPRRVIFNPGTENLALFDLCEQNNIEAVEACTLVMLATNQY